MKVLSINACILVRGIGFTYNDKKEERMAKMLKLFESYDIICIQEIWDSLWGKHAAFYNNCIKQGWFLSLSKVTGLTNTGNIILSKYLVESQECIVFKNSSTWQRLMSNGVVYSRILTPSIIHVFNTHFHCDTQPCLNSGKVRHKQLLELVEFMKDIVKTDEKWILCGDFNIRGDSDEYEVLKSIINADSLLEKIGFPNTYNNRSFLAPIGWKKETGCLDHIFTNLEIENCRVLTNVDLSDHFPIEVVVKIDK